MRSERRALLSVATAARPSSNPKRVARVPWFEVRREIPASRYRALAVSGFGLLIALWYWLSQREFVNPVFLPSPHAVWEAAGASLQDEHLWLDVRMSAFRVTAGFLLAAAIGVPLGIWIGAFKVVEGLLQPLTEFVRYIPVPALIPILMVLFGIDELSKIMLILVGTLFQLVVMVADEVRRVPYTLLEVSYTLRARRVQVIGKVIGPAAMPGIFDALRVCNGWAWTWLVVAELIAANEGLGYRILKFSRFLQTPKAWVYLLLLGAIGLGLDALFRLGQTNPRASPHVARRSPARGVVGGPHPRRLCARSVGLLTREARPQPQRGQ
jgi:NitT/TauT family transport system permease protein